MQHLIILILLILIAGLLFTVIKWKGGLHMTFSQHAATDRSSKIFYASLFLITMPLLLLFFANWLVPMKGLPSSFLLFATIAITFQILCTWVPEVGSRKTIIHRILTAISALAFLVVVAIIASLATLSLTIRLSAWIGLILMATLLGFALSKQKGFRYALLLQIGFYAIFFIVILLTTYL